MLIDEEEEPPRPITPLALRSTTPPIAPVRVEAVPEPVTLERSTPTRVVRQVARKEPRTTQTLAAALPVPVEVTDMDDLSDEDITLKKGRRRRRDGSESNSKRRRKKKKRSDRDSSDDEEEEDDDGTSKPAANNSATPLVSSVGFWASVDPYVAPFNPVDLAHLQPIDPNGVQTIIPPLGKHYGQQDGRQMEQEPDTPRGVGCGEIGRAHV